MFLTKSLKNNNTSIQNIFFSVTVFVILNTYIFSDNGNNVDQKDEGLKVSKFMPLNKPNLRVEIPQFKNGQLDCVIKAEEMTRVDKQSVKIKNMEIDFFENNAKQMSVILKNGKYNFSDNTLDSNDKTQVIRPNYFTLIGDSMEFDLDKKQGRMTGKVRMVIKNSVEVMNRAKKSHNFEKNEFDALFFSRGINSILESLKTIRR